MAAQFQPARSDQGSFNIKELFFKYLRFLPLFILSVALALGVAFIYLRYTTSVYQSSGQLVLKDQKGETSGQDEKFQQLFVFDRKNMQNEIEYIRSQPLMERVVETLNLNFSYYAKGKIKTQNIYHDSPFYIEPVNLVDSSGFNLVISFKSNSGFKVLGDEKLYSFGQPFVTPNGTFRLIRKPAFTLHGDYKVVFNSTPAMAAALRGNLGVVPKSPNSAILILTLSSENPFIAADVVNQLMQEYQTATIEDKNTTTRQMIAFIDDRLKIVSHELDSVTRTMLAYKQANNLPDIENISGEFYNKVDESARELEAQTIQITVLDFIHNYVSDNRNAFTLVPSTLTINDQTLSGLITSYNAAQLERKAMLDNYPEQNPKVVQKEEQLQLLRRNIIENIRNLKAAYNNLAGRINARNRQAQSNLQSLPQKLQNLIYIQRQQNNKLDIYNILVKKREESAISLAATISNIKVLEKAYPSLTPISPKPRSVQAIALIIGLIFPALIVLILELLDDKVKTREDIEKVTSSTILGEVGHSSAGQTMVVSAKSRGFVAEQFRIIRTNLQYVLTSTPNPVILVTSSFSGEGKSFICTNLGAVMALTGKKTVVLEFDIRKPKLLIGLNMPKKPGLTNYILGNAKEEDLPIPVENCENLYVVACGPVPPNPSELLLEKKLDTFMKYLKENFDVIVMDTAPVGMVSDALSLSRFADCTIYIVRQGVTHKKQISLLEEFNKEQKLPKVSIVLNDIKLRAGYGYYYGRYGYGYGYGTGYGYGYYDDDQKQSFLTRWFGWTGKNGVKKKNKKSVS
jgi:tyrosine-protein kinase Etk/Wzc